MIQKFSAVAILKGWCGILIAFFLLLQQHTLYAQDRDMRTANWFFCKKNSFVFTWNASVDYVLRGPEPSTTTLEAEWGCSSISTPSGDLLFYTNGETVWSASHSIMINGTGLDGDNTAKRSNIIVPKPPLLPSTEPDEYYIFYTTSDHKLKYAIVSISAGTVVLKNQNITPVGVTIGQALTACLHTNGRDVWLLAINEIGTKFYVYQITRDGVSGAKEYSTAQPRMTAGSHRLYIKFSPNGKYIGHTVQGNHDNRASNQIIIHNFDPIKGTISGHRQHQLERRDNSGNITAAVPSALEFSYNSEYVYVAALAPSNISWVLNYKIITDGSKVTRLDPKGTFTHPLASYRLYGGDLQLASDRYVYFVCKHIYQHTDSLYYAREVYRFPSYMGDIPVMEFGISSKPQIGTPEYYSLPNFVTSYLDDKAAYIPPCDECLNSAGGSVGWGAVKTTLLAPPQDYATASLIQVLYQTRVCNGIEELRIVEVITAGRDFPSTLYSPQRLFWYLEDKGLHSAYTGWINSVAPIGSNSETTHRFYQIPCWNMTYCEDEDKTFWEPCSDNFCCYREYTVGTDCNNQIIRLNTTSHPTPKGGQVNTKCGANLLPSSIVESCIANGARSRTIQLECERTEWKEIP
jgi:hypothetical protein